MEQIREEVTFTDGRVIIRGKLVARGKAKRADYILYFKPDIPLVVIEAKANKYSVGSGMMQALKYGAILDIPILMATRFKFMSQVRMTPLFRLMTVTKNPMKGTKMITILI
ncbi:type I restriction enzyme HsdR N-terminal domain-containing protein [Desulfococcaceae bacterium HSG7]|nr:type I restriction enzyme HsdR N-terminal domain-containing protein [Desulfococcaceae bacterium HSG7]